MELASTLRSASHLKVDRKARELLVQKWTWIAPRSKALTAAVEDTLGRFERFQLASPRNHAKIVIYTLEVYAGCKRACGGALHHCWTTFKERMVMKILERFLARVLHVFVKLLPRADDPTRSETPVSSPTRRHGDAMRSPWRIYRLYAINSRLLLRGETGRIISIGTYAGDAPIMKYNLGAGATRGPCSSLPLLLADVSEHLTASKLELSLAQASEHVIASVELDRSPHLDVSLPLQP